MSQTAAADWLLAVGASALFAWIFYRSVFGMACAVLVVPFVMKLRRNGRRQRYREEIQTGFCRALESVSGALRAGYSMETSWVEAERELAKLYGRNAAITQAFAGMNRQVQMNEPIEKCLMRFAMESGIEDLYHFAELFRYAKRNGGNMAEIIRSTKNRFREKEAVIEEIRTAVTAKQLEQRMMLVLVPGILLFTTISSPEYGEVLYHTPLGVLVMTACLIGYLAAALWGDRIVTIEV